MIKFRKRLRVYLSSLPRPWRLFIITIIGYTIIVSGILMLVLPGPGTLVILFGITILALEFEWAREASKQGQQWLEKILSKLSIRKKRDK